MTGKRTIAKRRRSKGFTLIELLVVIAIIALLVSILVPSLKDAKKLAQSAVCASNLHHIHVAIALYANEYDRYPGARFGYSNVGFGAGTVTMTLPGQISPAYGPPELFWCPAESKTLDGLPHPFFEDDEWESGGRHFGAYEVGSDDWTNNVDNQRLAWGTSGSTYAVPMSIGENEGGLEFEECLVCHAWLTFGGTIDLDSVAENPEALYMIDKLRGYSLWYTEDISERHRKPNYLTFGGSVEKASKEWLIGQAALGKEPWYFKWSRGTHYDY